MTPEWEAKLKELAALGPDWDSYGADVVSPKAIEIARKILAQSAPDNAINVTASNSGDVVIEWADGQMEISTSGIDFYAENSCGDSVLFRVPLE